MSANSNRYYVPAPSYWPIIGSIALLCMAVGATMFINHITAPGLSVLLVGLAILIYMLFGWFGTVARESENNKFNNQVDLSFRWGISWFIFSEVMFFAAFFGALFYMRVLSIPWLGDMDHKILWPDFVSKWPVAGPGISEQFTPMNAWGIPAINTLILLTSGVTVTLAHWGLKKGNRALLNFGLFLTIALGIIFLTLQGWEYIHSYHELNLKLTTGAYGASFFMLTGFHGFHVTLGTIMLMVIFGRCLAGHFKAEHHFGFEAVSWYWHFVDVVWLLLFVLVYWV